MMATWSSGRSRRIRTGSTTTSAPWNYHALPAALGCRRWFTAKVATLGELDEALAKASTAKSACYIEVVGGKLDLPAGLLAAHQRLDALYADD